MHDYNFKEYFKKTGKYPLWEIIQDLKVYPDEIFTYDESFPQMISKYLDLEDNILKSNLSEDEVGKMITEMLQNYMLILKSWKSFRRKYEELIIKATQHILEIINKEK